jgi:hypothetical protein
MRVKMTVAAMALAMLALVVPPSAAADGSRGEPGASVRVLASGLNDPRGIDADDGDRGDRLLVAQSGSGEITEIVTRKNGDPVIGAFATLAANSSPSDVVGYGFRTAFATAGVPPEGGGDPFGALVKVQRDGEGSLFADIAAYQQGDPDPVDQEDLPTESNPFGLALLRHGFLVADAAGNDLLKIRKDGSIETVARFPTRTLPFPEGIPEGPPPGTPIESEAVPTAVAVGPDGAWYVSELRGFPFTKGTSRIWRIEPGTEDAECDADAKRGPCRVFADGFTSVIDLAWADDTLLVLEIVKDGLLAAEAGTAPPIGALWAVDGRSKTEIAAGSLVAPGGVAVADEETIYVTTGTLLGPGAGEVVRIGGALDEDDDDERGGGKGNGHRGDDDDDDDDDRNHKGDRKSGNDKKHKSDNGDRKHDKKHKGKKIRKHDRDDD